MRFPRRRFHCWPFRLGPHRTVAGRNCRSESTWQRGQTITQESTRAINLLRSLSLLYWSRSSATAPYNRAPGKRGESTTSGEPGQTICNNPAPAVTPVSPFTAPRTTGRAGESTFYCRPTIAYQNGSNENAPQALFQTWLYYVGKTKRDRTKHRAPVRESNHLLTLVLELLNSTFMDQ